MELPGSDPSLAYSAQPALKKQWPSRGGTQPWTTTRCHRLLRPLRTHISALRREIELENAQRLDHEADGPVDAVNLDKPKIQQTYSRRGRRPTKPSGEHHTHLVTYLLC